MTVEIRHGALVVASLALLGLPLIAKRTNKHVSEAVRGHAKGSVSPWQTGHPMPW